MIVDSFAHPMTPLAETAYAKINLALHVRRRRTDGYHDLETVFAFAEDGDRLEAAPADDLSLTIAGPFAAELAADDDNLVLRAARALQAAAGVSAGAAIRLDKRLPVASGIGGGSADAAAALRLLARLWGVAGIDLPAIADPLGSDVPACVASVAAFGEGRGERLAPLDPALFGEAPLLLVNPGVPLSTGAVFRAWDGVDRGALDPRDPRGGRNDLEPPARALRPEIGLVLDLLGDAPFARMSGSGATCFAFYPDARARDAAHARIAAVQPGWWCLATRLR